MRKKFTQANLFGHPEPKTPRQQSQPPGWEKVSTEWPGKWLHESGWRVHHCAHPTAMWPYAIHDGNGNLIHIAPNGRAFRLLIQAMRAVEELASGKPAAEIKLSRPYYEA